MARTKRRKHYIPSWVTQDYVKIDDPHHGVMWAWVRLKGKAREKMIRGWHGDKNLYGDSRPPKPFRKEHQARYRSNSRRQLVRWMREQGFEVQIRRKPVLPYWN